MLRITRILNVFLDITKPRCSLIGADRPCEFLELLSPYKLWISVLGTLSFLINKTLSVWEEKTDFSLVLPSTLL